MRPPTGPALRSGAPRIEVVHCFLEEPGRPVAAPFDQSDRERLEASLLELAAGVVGGEFEPSDAPNRELCSGCPGQPALCVWGPDRTMAAP